MDLYGDVVDPFVYIVQIWITHVAVVGATYFPNCGGDLRGSRDPTCGRWSWPWRHRMVRKCARGTVETVEGQTLQFQRDGTQKTWCKIYHQMCTRVVSRKQGALQWIFIYQRREPFETIRVGREECCVHRPGFRWSMCSECSVSYFIQFFVKDSGFVGFHESAGAQHTCPNGHVRQMWPASWGGTELEPKHSTKLQMRGPTMHFHVFFSVISS